MLTTLSFAKTRSRKKYDSVPRVTMEETEAEHEDRSEVTAPSLIKHSYSFSANTYTPVNR